jgi:hypothetical protein
MGVVVMKRTSLNFLVDAIALAAFILLAATGVLVRYVLPAGSGHFSMIWGLDRHGWGTAHFWIAVVLLGCLHTSDWGGFPGPMDSTWKMLEGFCKPVTNELPAAHPRRYGETSFSGR